MPNRIIKESLCTSEKIAALKDFEFRLWIGLITQADDAGRGDARPAILKGRVFPLRDAVTIRNISDGLHALATVHLIDLYTVDGRPFYWLPSWSKHQRIRDCKPKYPGPEEADAAFGLPAGSFSVWEDSYYSPVEGAIAIHAVGYVPPQTPVQQVTVKVPWVEFTFNRSAAYTVPAALDRQAAGALAAAQYFLSHHHGTHHGLEPCTYDEATWSYTATEGAMYVRYSELEQFLGCVFAPDMRDWLLGGPLAADARPEPSLFYQGEGDTIRFMMSDRGGNIAYCGSVYTEPALQPDGSILFWQLSLYLDEDDENFAGWGPGNKYTPVEAHATPVRLVLSENGWRVAEYSLPN